MTPPEPPPAEDPLDPLLLAYDEALAAGSPPEAGKTLGAEGDPMVHKRFAQAQAFLHLIRRVWPGPEPQAPDLPPTHDDIRSKDSAAADTGPPSSFPADVLRRLGRFEICRELGRGGFGIVFLAQDPILRRPVALKVPQPEAVLTPDLRRRFLREGRAAAGLNHPNIISVYEVGEEGPLCYLTSEYCPGPTLAAWIAAHKVPVPLPTATRLVLALADAVQHAHSRGILHRDLKPGNVLLAPLDGAAPRLPSPADTVAVAERGPQRSAAGLEFVPKLTDFGLAKLFVPDAAGSPRDVAPAERSAPGPPTAPLTQTGAILGTPAYMAPEQARGRPAEVGAAADVYSLGVILYELLTGRRPFQGESDLETLLYAQREDPVPPSRLRPRIPRDLETICLKCLQKEAGSRYPSAAALAEELRRFLAGEPIRARPPGKLERLARWIRRHPAPAAALTFVVVLLAALTVTGLVIRRHVIERNEAIHAAGLVQALLSADILQVPEIIRQLKDCRALADPLLREEKERANADARRQLHISLALLPGDEAQAPYLYERLLNAEPREVSVLRDALAPHQATLVDKLWKAVAQANSSAESRLRTAAALASYDPDSPQWANFSGRVVEDLVAVPVVYLGLWCENFRPVRRKLLDPLAAVFRDRKAERASERILAANLLADYAADQPRLLADLLMDAEEKQFAVLAPKLTDHPEIALALFGNELKGQVTEKPAVDILHVDAVITSRNQLVLVTGAAVPRPLPAKVFKVDLKAGKRYDIAMRSKELDSFLVLQDKSGKQLAFDDDSGGNRDAFLTFTPPRSDTYHVYAAALERTGAFSLLIQESDAVRVDQAALAKRRANAGVALMRLNHPEPVWPLLEHRPDPSVRAYLIHRLGVLGVDPEAIVRRLDQEPSVSARRALVLSLGEFTADQLPASRRADLVTKLLALYETDPDSGLHAAAEWLLRQWGHAAQLDALDLKLQGQAPQQRRWYVNGRGQTMVLISGPLEFLMGSPPSEPDRNGSETLHKARINRSFAIAAKAVTLEQFRRFAKDYAAGLRAKYTRTPELPAVFVSWYMAAAYCNWLSKAEGIPEKQWCYEIVGNTTRIRANYLSLTGYRLPTEAEMEVAIRAGAKTRWHFGEGEDLLSQYSWYVGNSRDQPWPVGSKKPNDLGLFDVHGNSSAWCQEQFQSYPLGANPHEDKEDTLTVDGQFDRVLRGGSFYDMASDVRSAQRLAAVPAIHYNLIGFRLARTYR